MNEQYATLITELNRRITLGEAQELLASSQIKEQAEGTVVLSQGGAATASPVLFLLTGKLEVFMKSEGKTQVLSKVDPGNFLGAQAVLGIPSNASVRTGETSVMLEWSLPTFRNLLLHNPSLSEKVLGKSLPSGV